MLPNQKLIAFLATRDSARAKEFYRDCLGLRLIREDPSALVFDANGTMLRIAIVPQVVTAPYTALGWSVPDVVTAARSLREAGVKLERYPGLVQDKDGVWTSPSSAKVLWFKDPDGHTLSLTQF
jgi:catechol 2,3-dioxygenase-like lactoylglutathione lyase family enzyme